MRPVTEQDYYRLVQKRAQEGAEAEDLVRLVEEGLDQHPRSRDLLGWALGSAMGLAFEGHSRLAVRLAKRVADAARVSQSHATHFNLGETFRLAGKRKRSRHHYQQALRFADTEVDRRDALQGLEELDR